MTASKWTYSSGWFSTLTASRLSSGSSDGAFGTAHEHSTPSISSRKSQCIRVASCWWTTNMRAPRDVPGLLAIGSGVAPAVRFARYPSRAVLGSSATARYNFYYARSFHRVGDDLVRPGLDSDQALYDERIVRRHSLQHAARRGRRAPQVAIRLYQVQRDC